MLPYLIAWLGLCAIAVANGAIREKTYGRRLTELSAHQLSTLIAMALTTGVVYVYTAVYPITSARLAWKIGWTWLLLTIAFEFSFGRFVAGRAWRRLLADYNLLKGRIWGVFLVWLLLLPVTLYWARKTAL